MAAACTHNAIDDSLPRIIVTWDVRRFRAEATLHGWQLRTIELYLRDFLPESTIPMGRYLVKLKK